MKSLVVGWFSFRYGQATAGDLLAVEVLCDWLDNIGCDYDVAVDPPFEGGVDWRLVQKSQYSHVIFVCGPFDDITETRVFLDHFSGCQVIGLNLSMVQPLSNWNPFDALIERDSSLHVRPDMVFLTHQKLVPVVGVCLVDPYGAIFEERAYAAIQRLMASREVAIVNIDTRLDHNRTGLRSSTEVESLISRMDLVVTTRLHGMVLSIKNGIPVVAIDPGGDNLKIVKQAGKIGWPMVFTANDINDDALQTAFDYCLTPEARQKAQRCAKQAENMAGEIYGEFLAAFASSRVIAGATNGPDFPKVPPESYTYNPHRRRIDVKSTAVLSWGTVSRGGSRLSMIGKIAKLILQVILPASIFNWLKMRLEPKIQ